VATEPFAPTTVAAWPLAVIDLLEQRGLDVGAALALAGLDLSWLRAHPGGRVDTSAMALLWGAAQRLSGDPAIGLRVGQRAHPMHLRVMGLLLQTAPDLAHMLDFAVRFHALISTSVTTSQRHRPEAVGLVIRPLPGAPVHPCAIDAFVAAHVASLGRVARPSLVTGVALHRKAPADAGPWHKMLGVCVEFDADVDIIWHDRSRIEEPLPLGDAHLASQHLRLAEQALAELDRAPPLVRTLRGLLRSCLSAPPPLGELARVVGMSERSLRRRLKEVGSGYRPLLEALRAERAADLLCDDRLSLEGVAEQLGFSDASNFGKAFKRWYGVSPDRFRQER
jgi:AraC-like DNA-binding protein